MVFRTNLILSRYNPSFFRYELYHMTKINQKPVIHISLLYTSCSQHILKWFSLCLRAIMGMCQSIGINTESPRVLWLGMLLNTKGGQRGVVVTCRTPTLEARVRLPVSVVCAKCWFCLEVVSPATLGHGSEIPVWLSCIAPGSLRKCMACTVYEKGVWHWSMYYVSLYISLSLYIIVGACVPCIAHKNCNCNYSAFGLQFIQ